MWWPPPPCAGYLAHPFSKSMMLLLIYSFFSELRHALMKGCKSISCVSIHHAAICPVHPLLQGETRGGTAIGYGGQIDQPRRMHFGLLFLSFDWTDWLLHPMGFRAPTLLSSSSNRPLPFCEAPCR
jgi:hypothetical protein